MGQLAIFVFYKQIRMLKNIMTAARNSRVTNHTKNVGPYLALRTAREQGKTGKGYRRLATLDKYYLLSNP